MPKITLIVPIVTDDSKCVGQFKKMLESLKTVNGLTNNVSEIIVAATKFHDEFVEAYNEIGLEKFVDFTVLKNEEKTYAGLVNSAVMSVSTDYFTVLSVNDVYSPHWIDDFLLYEEDVNNVSAYLTLGVNKIDEEKAYFINEIAWSSGFANRHGYVDMDGLLTLTPFKTSGGFFNTEEFITLGKLKEGLTVATWFDYLLRVAESEKGIYVIPRVTYIVDGTENDSFTGVGNSDINNYNSGEFDEVAKPYRNEKEEPKQPTIKVVDTKKN